MGKTDACLPQPEFLEALRGLSPDLCVTAAYGNILPQAFLNIPRWGTLNIHPSLLPLYRGAAPVQRALEVTHTALPLQSANVGSECDLVTGHSLSIAVNRGTFLPGSMARCVLTGVSASLSSMQMLLWPTSWLPQQLRSYRAQALLICTQEGVTETGVSVVFIVRAMVAEPALTPAHVSAGGCHRDSGVSGVHSQGHVCGASARPRACAGDTRDTAHLHAGGRRRAMDAGPMLTWPCWRAPQLCQNRAQALLICTQEGVAETGVSVAFTVRAMDAGPVLAQERVQVDDSVQAPELLADLFQRGAQLLLQQLPAVAQGAARDAAVPQVHLPRACKCWPRS